MGFRLERSGRSLAHLGLALLVLGAAATRVGAQSSAPVELSGVPYRLNDNGDIAGWVFVGNDAHAAIYSNGVWQDLGVPAGERLSALFSINNLGAVVGYSFFTNYLPFPNTPPLVNNRWQAIGSPGAGTPVAVLSGLTPDSFAYGINDSGAIVGCRNRDDDDYPDPHHAFLYSNGTVTDLHAMLSSPATLQEPVYTCAWDINSAGDVVGEVSAQNSSQRGFLISQGSVRQLVDGASYLFDAKAINDAGQIVGEGQMSGSFASHALLYQTATGKISSLGLEGTGAFNSRPNDINSRGDVVGTMSIQNGSQVVEHAFLASGGQAFDLNDLIPPGGPWVLQNALSINSQGQVVGLGYRTSSPTTTRYFLLTVTLTPQQRTAALIDTIQDLVAAGVLGSGNGNALIVKLEGAMKQLEKGNIGPAVNKIEAFINQVQAFIQSGKLTAGQGQPLINAANGIIASLTS